MLVNARSAKRFWAWIPADVAVGAGCTPPGFLVWVGCADLLLVGVAWGCGLRGPGGGF